MAFTFNGNIPSAITYNSNDVLILKWNGTTVWEKNSSPTGDTPYTYLDWIQPDLSSTNPFFDTNYVPSVTTTIEVKFGSYVNENCWWFGGYVAGQNLGIGLGCPNLQNGMTMYSVAGSRFYDTTIDNWGATNTWVFSPTSTTHNGNVVKTYSQCTSAYTTTIKIFNAPSSSTSNTNSFPKFYYMKSYDNGVLTHNIVPVIRNSDNKVGLYDTVADNFISPNNSNSRFFIPTQTETYARFNGNTYFTLDAVGNRDFKITMDIAKVNTSSSSNMAPFGVANSNSRSWMLLYYGSTKKWQYKFSNNTNNGSTTVNSGNTYHVVFESSGTSTSRRCNYVMTENGDVVDKSTTARSFTSNVNVFTMPLFLGGSNNNSSVGNLFTGLIKDVKVFVSGSILYDYEFVEHNGSIVMHEKINNTYLSPTQGSVELVSV